MECTVIEVMNVPIPFFIKILSDFRLFPSKYKYNNHFHGTKHIKMYKVASWKASNSNSINCIKNI